MDKNHCVYMHKNKINGKVYIGQTNNIKTRWKPKEYQHCVKFYAAIEKYGWENFEHIVLASNLTLSEANELEYQLIKQYNATIDGYNIYLGGNNRQMPPETINKLSQKSLELWQNKEYQEKQHISRLQSWQGELGEQRKQALSMRSKEQWKDPTYREQKIKYGGDHPNARKIVCITTGEIFNSIAEATKKYGVQHSNIYKCCKGQRNSCGKHPKTKEPLRWRYFDE